MKRFVYPHIGSVSEGTLRTDDLLNSFASNLSYEMKRMRLTREQRKRFNALLRDYETMGDDDANPDFVDDFIYALDEIAAPYSYFGANEGDGACFGFWPIVDNDELPRLEDGAEIPREHWGEDVYLVNDHGNVSCGYVDRKGKFHEYWSCV